MAKRSPFIVPIERIALGAALLPREGAVSFSATDFDATDAPTTLYSDADGASIEGAVVIALKASGAVNSYIRPTGSGGTAGLDVGRFDLDASGAIPGVWGFKNDDGSGYAFKGNGSDSTITSTYAITLADSAALTVGGVTTLGTLLAGDTFVGGTLGASGAVVLASTLDVGGAATVGSTLGVTGASALHGVTATTLSVTAVGTALSVSHDASILGGLSVTGTVALSTALGATSGGTGQSSATAGDLLYASASNVWGKRTVGSTGDVLTVAGGVPTWAAQSTLTIAESQVTGLVADLAAKVPTSRTVQGTAGEITVNTLTTAVALSSNLTLSIPGTITGARTLSGAVTLSAASTALTVTNDVSIGGGLTLAGVAINGYAPFRIGKGSSDATPTTTFGPVGAQAVFFSAQARFVDFVIKNEGTAVTADNTNYATINVRLWDTSNTNVATYSVTTKATPGSGVLGSIAAYSVSKFSAVTGISLPTSYASSNYTITFDITKAGVGVTLGIMEFFLVYIP